MAANLIPTRKAPSPKRYYKDSFLWLTIALPSIALIAFNIHFSFHPELDIERAFLQLALGSLWLLIACIRLFFSISNELPKKTASLLLSLALLWPTSTLLKWFPVGDYIHLATAYPEYKIKIDTSPQTRLKFDWGGFGFLVGADRTLIYDPTDMLPQENKIRNAELKKNTCQDKEDACFALTTKNLFDHFYLVTEWH